MSLLSEKEKRFHFEILGGSAATGVVEVTLQENISAPYQADLVLVSTDVIPLQDAVGKEGLLTIEGAATDRLVHGIITRFAQTGKRGRHLLYEARLTPQLWLLSQRRNSRIFQGDNVQDIVTKVIKDAQIPQDRTDFRLKETYAALDYAVQYQETDLAFVSRLTEEDGIWFFFEQSKDKDVVVFADSASAYKPIEGDAAVVFNQAEGMPPKDDMVYQWAVTQSIVSGKMSQNDFNYTKPSTSLSAEKEAKSDASLEVYEHPGRYADEETGKRLVQARLEELSAMKETARGRSTCPRLTPGYTFKLKGHETSAFNQEYLVVAVTHYGKEHQALQETATAEAQSYYNEFIAIPSSVTLRPPRVTPRPVIAGSQTAIVVGAKGEEIYTDDQGRIKVKFHWDRAEEKNEKSSCWVRVGQLWTGEAWGSMFVPRTGQEVIVSFLEGDPNRPIVTGRVYNGANPPPHGLPDNKTKSTIMSNSTKGGGGHNELTFDDAKGSEQIHLHGQKDLAIEVGNDKTQTVGNDEKHDVKHDQTYAVGNDETYSVGNDQKLSVTNNRIKTVGADETCSITGDKSESVTGNEDSKVTGNRTSKTSGFKNETITLASAETIGLAKALSVGAAYQVSVGGLMNESVALAKMEEVGKLKMVLVGTNMSEKVAGSRTMSAGKSHGIKAKDITIEADSSIVIKTGKSSIAMKSDGTIEISGKTVSFKGKEAVIDGSSKLTLTSKKINHN